LAQNYFNDGANKYIATGFATSYGQSTGQHIWYNAPSGTAGNAVTFTQGMTLDASSRLLVGTTTLGIAGNSNTVLSLANGNAEIFQSIRASGGEELLLSARNNITVTSNLVCYPEFLIFSRLHL
jgi:hypothetical protein